MLQLKQIMFMWLLVGNGVLAAWALILYATKGRTGPLYFRLVAFLQVLVLISVAAGFGLLFIGVPTTWAHVMYAVLNGGLALGRLLGHGRLAAMGRQGLTWHIGLALLAIALIARSSVTARH